MPRIGQRPAGLTVIIWALLSLLPLAAANAQPRPASTPVATEATVSVERLAAAEARADKAERELELQNTITEIRAAQTDQTLSAIELMIGIFGILITVIVIFFALKIEQAAIAAARKELEEASAKIEDLRKRAQAASQLADNAATEASSAHAKAVEAAEHATEALKAAEAAAQGASTHHVRTQALQREAAAIVDELKANASAGQPTLTAKQTEKLREAAGASARVPEADWSIDEFKAAIGNAMYVEENWQEARRLAMMMAEVHQSDAEALAYAYNRTGDAERELGCDEEALLSYEKVVGILPEDPSQDAELHLLWARHSRGIVMDMLGRPSEAEKELKLLLPICEKIFGSDAKWTLSLQFSIASAILDQGRVDEAERTLEELTGHFKKAHGSNDYELDVALYQLSLAKLYQNRPQQSRELLEKSLPRIEAREGIQSSSALVTRYTLAAAILDEGDARAAQSLLDTIPEPVDVPGWTSRYQAAIAFARGRVSDALGETGKATLYLREAEKQFSACLPPDHFRRRLFDTYMTNRASKADPDA